MFGELIGYGDYGFVFEDETEINGPDGAVVKIMTLDTPGWECNLQQYNMFAQLMNHQDQGVRTPGLPAVFKHFRGQMDLNLLNILSYMGKDTDPYAVRALRESIPVGSEYAVIIMEKLPCVATNQYCGRNLKDSGNIAEEQSVYEQMVKYLYDSGWWVRDVIDPRNVGYNLHGSPVWFDPMVARRRGFPGYSSDAIAMCHEEVDAYPSSYRKAVQDGSYFTQRHGYGLFHTEDLYSRLMGHSHWTHQVGNVQLLDPKQNRNWPFIQDSPLAINFGNHNFPPPILTGDELEGAFAIMPELQEHYFYNSETLTPYQIRRSRSKELLHKAKNWPYIKSFVPFRPSDEPEFRYLHDPIKILNSWEDLDPSDIGRHGAWYYVNFPLTVYRGSQKNPRWSQDGIEYETYLEHDYIKPNRLGINMGYTDVIATSPYLHEALNYETADGIRETELYSFDIQDYVVTFPRPSQPKNWGDGADYGKPVVMIAGGVSFDDATLLWSRDMHGNIYHAESFVSRDYPQCYLCGLPAKIEVLTAVGMRNFCSNKCRGDYEGIDYGPDDYFISPKLEHQLSIVKYSPGIQLDYEKDIEAKVTIQCQNCPLVIKYKFPESHVRRRGDWHKHKDEEGNTMDKEEIGYCDHDMSVIKYISNDWERAGMAAIRCHKCQLADEMPADIPEGCSNLGSQKPKWFGSEPDWEDIDWSEPPKKDDLGDEVEWEADSYQDIIYKPRGWLLKRSGYHGDTSAINFTS